MSVNVDIRLDKVDKWQLEHNIWSRKGWQSAPTTTKPTGLLMQLDNAANMMLAVKEQINPKRKKRE